MAASPEECFQLFDPEGAGTISTKDLGEAVRAMGLNPSENKLLEVVVQIDPGNGGKYSYGDFFDVLGRLKADPCSESEIVDAFKRFDKENKGSIVGAEFRHLLMSMGERLTEEQADEVMREAGFRDDSQINYADFAKTMLG